MVAYSLHFPHGHTKVHTWKELVYNWYFITKGKAVQARICEWYKVQGPRSMITLCALHSFLVVVKKNAGYTYVPCVGNSDLEIRIDGCSGGPQ